MPPDAPPTAPTAAGGPRLAALRARRRTPAPRADRALGAAMLLDAVVEALIAPAGLRGTAIVAFAGALVAAGLWQRSVRPLLAVLSGFAGFAMALSLEPAAAGLVGPYGAPVLVMFLSQLRLRGRRTWAAVAIALACLLVGLAFDPAAEFPQSIIAGTVLYIAAPTLAAALARGHSDRSARLRAARERLDADRAAHAAARAAEERLRTVHELDRRLVRRLARLAADAATSAAARDPAGLRAVEQGARAALDEVRRALFVLRDDGPTASGMAARGAAAPRDEDAAGGAAAPLLGDAAAAARRTSARADAGDVTGAEDAPAGSRRWAARWRAPEGARWTAADLLPAAVVLAVGVADAATTAAPPAPHAVGIAIAATAGVVLAARRRAPELVAAAVFALGAVQWSLLGGDGNHGCVLALPIATFSLGAHARAATGRWGLLLAAAGGVAVAAPSGPESAFDVAGLILFATLGWAAGREIALRARTEAAERAAVRSAEEARAREADTAAVAARRALARDVHDVLAGALTGAVLQARVAHASLVEDDAPEPAARAARAAADAARRAREELDRLLADADDGAGLDEVPALVERAAAAGLDAELAIAGTPRPLAPDADLAAHRLVQEALTNALRHAGGARTTVTLAYEPERLRVVVANASGGASPPVRGHGGGHGLAGMRERVAAVGGTVAAGPRGDGGWTVEATFPL